MKNRPDWIQKPGDGACENVQYYTEKCIVTTDQQNIFFPSELEKHPPLFHLRGEEGNVMVEAVSPEAGWPSATAREAGEERVMSGTESDCREGKAQSRLRK